MYRLSIVIITMLVMGVLVLVNMDEPEIIKTWDQKYSGHNFSKTDLDNSSLFNITDISNYMCYNDNYYCHFSIKLVEFGVQIVKENNEFILQLPTTLQPRNHVIILKNKNIIYTITWIKTYIDNICLIFNNKKYYFHDLSQIELYFDIQKQLQNRY